jgi:hypothetical protein
VPFGAGPRTCVGQRLAMMEAVQILSSVVKHFDFKLDGTLHTPYTIHHTPYTIHRTPYTIPYTLYPIPYTLYTIHHTLYTPCTLYPTIIHSTALNLPPTYTQLTPNRYRIRREGVC